MAGPGHRKGALIMEHSTPLSAAISGFALGAGLIVAIGAQNAFILRQGLVRSHVFILCLICALADVLLIAAGMAGMGLLISSNRGLLTLVSWAGAAFLAAYGLLALRRAFHPGSLHAAGDGPMTLKAAILTVLAFTFLNPHVYLDTVVLIGALSARHSGAGRLAFGAGAAAASFIWFFALGYGARLLTPLFARPAAWRVLDALIALVMFTLAARLLLAA